MQKGFTVFVGHLAIRAMRTTADGDLQAASQSEAQSFHVYRRGPNRAEQFQRTEQSFDAAFAFCVQPIAMH